MWESLAAINNKHVDLGEKWQGLELQFTTILPMAILGTDWRYVYHVFLAYAIFQA